MDLFPLYDGNRKVPSAPGARKAACSVEDAAGVVRDVLAHLEQEGLTAALFPALAPEAPADHDPEPDPDPDLGPVLGLCGPRLLTRAGIAILPPDRRFNCARSDQAYRMFAVGRWANGVNGYALAPSDWRPELSVWAYSDRGLHREGEWDSVAQWLVEFVEPLQRYTAGETDPAQRAVLVDDWSEHAMELWSSIEGDLLRPQPRPDWSRPGPGDPDSPQEPSPWSGEVVAGRPQGLWTCSRDGVVVRAESYVQGRRHGPATRWHVDTELRPDADDDAVDADADDDLDADPFVYRQGHVEREGTYVDGAAHGVFRFFDDRGRLLQEGSYEHGWPQGRWTVHPAAARGLVEPAYVEYDAGVPVSWSIPPLAFDCVELVRDGGALTTLAELARGSRGVVLLDCADEPVHNLPQRAVTELAGLPELLVLGVHPDTPGSGRLGERAVDVVADPTGGLTRAYGATPDRLLAVTCLDAEGGFRGAFGRSHAEFKHLLVDDD